MYLYCEKYDKETKILIDKEQKFFKGSWWLPENPDNKVIGTLKISNKKILLELEGKLKVDEPIFLLNGKTTDKIDITLLDCYIENGLVTTISDGAEIFETIINCNYAFVGIAYKNEEDIKFDEISARYSYFTGWTGIKRPEITHKNSLISIDNLEYHTISTILEDGTEIILKNYWFPDYFTSHYTDEINLKKYSDVGFKFKYSLLFKNCLEYIFYFGNFVSISLRKSAGVLEIFLPKIEDIKKRIQIYCNFYEDYEENRLVYHNALFTLKEIEDNFGTYLYNFFKKKEIIKYIVDVYCEIIKSKITYISEEFLLYTRLLEAYHRCNPEMESFYLDTKKFRESKKIVLDLIEKYLPGLKKWVSGAIDNSNYKSFSSMLREIINSIKYILIAFAFDKRTVDIFIKKVKDARNMLTHPRDEDEEKNNEYVKFIYPMTKKLEIVLLSLTLKEIGFEDEKVKNILMSKSELRYYYRDHNWKLEPGKFIIG